MWLDHILIIQLKHGGPYLIMDTKVLKKFQRRKYKTTAELCELEYEERIVNVNLIQMHTALNNLVEINWNKGSILVVLLVVRIYCSIPHKDSLFTLGYR